MIKINLRENLEDINNLIRQNLSDNIEKWFSSLKTHINILIILNTNSYNFIAENLINHIVDETQKGGNSIMTTTMTLTIML